MYLYFLASQTNDEKFLSRYLTIKEILVQHRVAVSYHTPFGEKIALPNEVLNQLEITGESVLDKMDAFIIEASHPDPEVGYLLAYAISRKKPTLCLYDYNKSPRHLLRYFATQKKPSFLKMHPYRVKDLENIIIKFLKELEKSIDLEDITKIKFTLRYSPKIERYLSWKTQNTKMSKADFIRKTLERLMKEDKDYQSYLKKIGYK